MTTELDSPLGTKRIYLDDTEWRSGVRTLMENADKIIELFPSNDKNRVPHCVKFNFENVIQLKTVVKRDAGIIKKWKNTILIVTYQGHILFIEETTPSGNIEKLKESTAKEKKENEKEKSP